jgi:hypothetical protein
LSDPAAAWQPPAICTFHRNNHAVRSEGWRYIRYADGGEELYDETSDPYEWTNLAANPDYASRKAELAKWLPERNVAELPRNSGAAKQGAARKKKSKD